jgi:hypothetical protein
LIERRSEPARLMRADHPRALDVAVATSNRIDRSIAEWVEANLPAILAALSPPSAPGDVGELVEKVQWFADHSAGSIAEHHTAAATALSASAAEVEALRADLASAERALARRTEERNNFAQRLCQAATDLRTVGDDYPGSSCHKWCHERADAALTSPDGGRNG